MSITSNWDKLDYPILINPKFSELVWFASREKWDTLRICVDQNDIAIASGHGNTHSSITSKARTELRYRFFPATYILFRDGQEFYFNMEDVSGNRREYWRDCEDNFSNEHWDMIKELVNLYGIDEQIELPI